MNRISRVVSRELTSIGTVALGAVILSCVALQAQVNVTTQRYDSFRTSSNLQETILNPSTVSPSTFGLLWSYAVDGDVFAQPLYVANVNVAGRGVHNVLYVVTMHDVVYAFDADNAGPPLWVTDLRNAAAGIAPYLSANFENPAWVHSIGDAFGILSTPAIDLSSNLMYAVSLTNEPAGLVYRLHAFDIRSGAEPMPSTVIQATSQGIVFDPVLQNQRPALLLSGGQVYIGFGGRPEDDTPYRGWLMTYSAATLAQTSVFVVNTTSSGGAIWQGGGGPATDENGNVYAVSGNGFGNGDGVTNYSESLLKFSFTNGQISLLDWFTPADSVYLDANDYDLGSAGPLVIPGAGLTALGSKTADFYMANDSNLGKLTTNNSGLDQTFHVGTGYPATFADSNLIVGLALWPKATGSILYAWPAQDFLYSYTLSGNQFGPTSTSTVQSDSAPGPGMVLTANGTQSGTGILWAEMSLVPGGDSVGKPGVLRAFNADTLTELWDSNLNSARDGIADNAKFAVPTVVNGRAYVPTFAGLIQVYGLLSSPNFTLSASPSAITVSQSSSGTSTVSSSPLGGFAGTVTYSASGAPGGVTISISPMSTAAAGQAVIAISVASTVAGGATYPIVITGTSGSLAHSTTVSLTIPAYNAPSISITAPANNTNFADGSNIAITAQASTTGATVSQVVFLQGAVTLGTVTQAPYTFIWSGVGPGSYQLTAKVTDSLGGTATSVPVNIVVSSAVSINIAPATVTLTTGQQQQFTATVNNTSNTAVIWSAPSAGTLTSAGLYTAPASILSQQNVSIVATSVADTSKVATATVTLTPAANFNLSANPSTLSIAQGASATSQIVVSPANGFAGSPTFSVSGLPANVTASFSPASSSTSSTITVSAAANAVPGTYSLNVAGASGALSHSVTLSLTVSGSVPGSYVSVNLASADNVYAIWSDGTPTQHGALDVLGDGFSANLLGPSLSALGVSFTFGSPGIANAASSTTVPLPAGNFASLKFLATGNNGSQLPIAQSARNRVNQTFLVAYTDGTTSTFTQSLSDFGSPQNYAGETIVETMGYVDNSKGKEASGPWYLYGYSFTLNSAKTVQSITLPTNRGVVVLAMDLVGQTGAPPPPPTPPTSVSLTSAANVYGIFHAGRAPINGGLDNDGYAYAENLIGGSIAALGVTFPLGASDAPDAVYGRTINLPSGNYSTLKFLGTGVNGNQINQTFIVTYTDGTTNTFTQSLSDWAEAQNFSGESVASTAAYRVTSSGDTQNGPWFLYGYSLTLDNTRNVKNITLPNNRNVVVLAMYLQ